MTFREFKPSEYLPKHIRGGKYKLHESPKDEIEEIARRAWIQQGRVIVKPDELKETDWVLAQSAIKYAEKRWGKRSI